MATSKAHALAAALVTLDESSAADEATATAAAAAAAQQFSFDLGDDITDGLTDDER